jgi:DNA topoisomerase-1
MRGMASYWSTLRHNGVYTGERYSHRGTKLRIGGRPIELSDEAEMMAFAYARKLGTVDDTFVANFERDFLPKLPEDYRRTRIKDMDFSDFVKTIEQDRMTKKDLSKEERALKKEAREKLKEKYGFALMDGKAVPIANWAVEPPGLFIGRGNHPLRGRWKPPISESDIVLNLDKGAPIPQGNWKCVISRPDAMWIAYWDDRLTGKRKYVWLHESSRLSQQRNKEKYDRALKLGERMSEIRKYIIERLDAKDITTRKVATACYLIDSLSMRVGDEKDSKEEADTVGATTLRKEHVSFIDHRIRFDFLGKDSVHWEKEIVDPPASLANNLRSFMDDGDTPLLFAGITSRNVNNFLGKKVKGLTAKVFRTYRGTTEVFRYLNSVKRPDKLPEYEKIYHTKVANLNAAIALNHKRTPPKNWDERMRRLEERIDNLRKNPPKTPKAKQRRLQVINKYKMRLKFARMSRDYNLITSFKNYVDPRVIKGWCDKSQLTLDKVYSASLRNKFMWVNRSKISWNELEGLLSA